VRAQRGPVLLVEPSDNIGGGAPGDATSLLRHLLDKSYGSAEDWTSWKASVVINDSSAAAELMANSDLPIGGTATLSSLGGRGSALSAAPIESLRVELLARSDGEFDLENPNSHLASMVGLHISVRKTQLLSHSIVMMIFLQDRLGTNIVKALKRRCVFRRWAQRSSCDARIALPCAC
jgi:microcystin degradation protein MlrC